MTETKIKKPKTIEKNDENELMINTQEMNFMLEEAKAQSRQAQKLRLQTVEETSSDHRLLSSHRHDTRSKPRQNTTVRCTVSKLNTQAQLDLITRCMSELGGELSSEVVFSTSGSSSSTRVSRNSRSRRPEVLTTHIICHQINASRQVKRTLKYMLGMVAGCWIVDFSWVEASAVAGYWVDENPFEISRDDTNRRSDVGRCIPALARESQVSQKPHLLFGTLTCSLSGLFSDPKDIPKSSVIQLLTVGGASMVSLTSSRSLLQDLDNPTSVVIFFSKDVGKTQRKKLEQCYPGIPVLSVSWVLDSISHYRTLPYTDYMYTK